MRIEERVSFILLLLFLPFIIARNYDFCIWPFKGAMTKPSHNKKKCLPLWFILTKYIFLHQPNLWTFLNNSEGGTICRNDKQQVSERCWHTVSAETITFGIKHRPHIAHVSTRAFFLDFHSILFVAVNHSLHTVVEVTSI